jgi:CubicO group peptidase (beta-lactamase class C family)
MSSPNPLRTRSSQAYPVALCFAAVTFFMVGSLQAQTPADYMRMIETGDPEAYPDSIAALSLGELMAHYGVPGVSLAVIKDFEIHWAKGYGIADVETGVPVTTETLFQAGSISKPVAAMA